MTVRLHKSSQKTKKYVKLDLIEDGGMVSLVAMTEDGDEYVVLIDFYPSGPVAVKAAKQSLDNAGYDTSFASWTDDGAMLVKQE